MCDFVMCTHVCAKLFVVIAVFIWESSKTAIFWSHLLRKQCLTHYNKYQLLAVHDTTSTHRLGGRVMKHEVQESTKAHGNERGEAKVFKKLLFNAIQVGQ